MHEPYASMEFKCSCKSSEMNGDDVTFQHPNDHQPASTGSSGGIAARRSLTTVAITPPPPSAPVEFLDAQWTDKPCIKEAEANVEAVKSLTPPPPSAPGEFLLSQWLDGKSAESQPRGIDLDFFASVIPDRVESAEHLERIDSQVPSADRIPEQDEGIDVDESPTRIRGVHLAAGEEIDKVFLPNEGLVESVPQSGQALILTNQRLIAFRGIEGFRDTHMAVVSEITQCSVRTGQRNWNAVVQGLMIMVGGGFLYLIVGYWLAGQISGPNVPVLNIDVAPLIALLIILVGVAILVQNYFIRPAGAVIFQGVGMEIAFPFRSSLDLQQVYDLVDVAQAHRSRAKGM